MTPLEFARQLVKELDELAVPDPLHAQLGDVIVDCEGTIVSITNKTEQVLTEGAPQCGVIELADIVVVAARECSNVANDDGTTDWAKMDAVSASLDHDGAILEDWADGKMAEAFFRLGRPVITYTIQGGIAFVTLTMTLPIP